MGKNNWKTSIVSIVIGAFLMVSANVALAPGASKPAEDNLYKTEWPNVDQPDEFGYINQPSEFGYDYIDWPGYLGPAGTMEQDYFSPGGDFLIIRGGNLGRRIFFIAPQRRLFRGRPGFYNDPPYERYSWHYRTDPYDRDSWHYQSDPYTRDSWHYETDPYQRSSSY